MSRRLSRGTPAMLSVKEQELLVRSADQDPLMREAIETLTGRNWDDLNFGQRLVSVGQEMEKARGAAYITQTLNSRADLRRAIDEAKGQVSVEERLERTENELQVAKDRISELTEAAATLPPRSS